jgi:hypothetical protein
MEIQKTTIVTLTVICSFILIFIPEIQIVKAENIPIYIRTDGSIEGTDKIRKDGNIYTLTGNIEGNVTIERSDVVIYGDWYTIQDFSESGFKVLTIRNANNVTVKNLIIAGNRGGVSLLSVTNSQIIDNVISRNQFLNDSYNGISGLDDCKNNVISGNFVANFSVGIYFRWNSTYSHTIIGNTIKSNYVGIQIMMGHEGNENGNNITGNQIIDNNFGVITQWYGEYYLWKPDPFETNNKIYKNNFINNTQNFLSGHILYDPDTSNVWDNGINGNYWSDYNGTDNNEDGIGDTPYILDANNIDNYPLMAPLDIKEIPEFPSWTIVPLFSAITLSVALIKKRLLNQSS